MVYALACASLPREHRSRRALQPFAAAFHRKAMDQFPQATVGGNVATLRALALLALYGLFVPEKTNVTQAIIQAVRLCIDLNLHESQDRSSYRLLVAIWCIERQVCLALDRPWMLPDMVRLLLVIRVE
jgi:hypothetical protein